MGPRGRSICVVESLLVVRISRIEGNAGETSVSKLGDSSAYKVAMIERNGAIRYSLVPKYQVKTMNSYL